MTVLVTPNSGIYVGEFLKKIWGRAVGGEWSHYINQISLELTEIYLPLED